MTTCIMPMTDQDMVLATARSVLRRPAEYGEAHQRAAAQVLMDLGDWMDSTRGRAMLEQLDCEARERARATEEDRLWVEAEKRAEASSGEGWDGEDEGWAALYARAARDFGLMLVTVVGALFLLVGLGVLQ